MADDLEGNASGELAREVMRHFFVPSHKSLIPELETAVAAAAPALLDVAQAFVYSVEAAISTVSMPSQLAIAGAHRWHFQRIHIAELIRARSDLGPDGEPTDEALQAAWKRANVRMEEELASQEGVGKVADSACELLLAGLKKESFSQAADELLLQGVVLVWGAFEVLARELFVRRLNACPSEAVKLVSLPEGRRLFQLKALDFETLAEYGFNLSTSMGTVLASAHDLSSLAALKTVFYSILPDNPKLQETLRSKELWTLNQRRHLIVHKRGIVDSKYIASTGDTRPIGQRLSISPKEIMSYVVLVQRAAADLLTALSATESSSIARSDQPASGPAEPSHGGGMPG